MQNVTTERHTNDAIHNIAVDGNGLHYLVAAYFGEEEVPVILRTAPVMIFDEDGNTQVLNLHSTAAEIEEFAQTYPLTDVQRKWVFQQLEHLDPVQELPDTQHLRSGAGCKTCLDTGVIVDGGAYSLCSCQRGVDLSALYKHGNRR